MSLTTEHNGFSLIEAMIAMLITAISFAGIFTLTAYSSTTLKNAVDRQKLQLIANQMFEIINSDYASVDNYNNMDFTTCNAPTGGQTQAYHQNRYKWCRMINDTVGTPSAGDVRKINVTTSGTSKNVRIILQSKKNATQIVINNVYN